MDRVSLNIQVCEVINEKVRKRCKNFYNDKEPEKVGNECTPLRNGGRDNDQDKAKRSNDF